MHIKDLGKKELWALRKEIVLYSAFESDYENSFGIDPSECLSFFEGYIKYLLEGHRDRYWIEVIEELDNEDNLYGWFLCVKW